MAKRHQYVEHAVLTLVIEHGDHDGYAPTLPTLVAKPIWPRVKAAKPPPSSRKSSTIAALC
ncbi:MAG: hypothetical protein ACRETP_07240 [Steroidobacteraceae bacterium]